MTRKTTATITTTGMITRMPRSARPGSPATTRSWRRRCASCSIEKRLFGADEIRRQIEVLDSRTPALGAKVVARAWVDPAFKARLLADGRAACEELGISFYDDTGLIVLENTDQVHNLIVCTLCSCYPRPVLGLPPDWYKLKPYRARAVVEPRAVLAEFGTIIPGRGGDPRQRFHGHGALPRPAAGGRKARTTTARSSWPRWSPATR